MNPEGLHGQDLIPVWWEVTIRVLNTTCQDHHTLSIKSPLENCEAIMPVSPLDAADTQTKIKQ
jgi:hypothetical protein